MRHEIPVLILAGGLGTRLKEETEDKPKPMVSIGGKPILWHIMKLYSHYGFYRFIILLGYKGETIKKYFLEYQYNQSSFTVNTRTGSIVTHNAMQEEWEVTLLDTGALTMTGGRVAQAFPYIDSDHFCLTYGDAVADVDLNALLTYHKNHGKIGTMTTVPLPSRFGNIQHNKEGLITSFLEKNQVHDELINGGFFVFKKEAFKYLPYEESLILEQGPLQRLVKDQELMMREHYGFWQCMDTLREKQKLEDLWQAGAPWKLWNQQKEYTPASTKQVFV